MSFPAATPGEDPALLVIGHDITERRCLQERLRLSEERFRTTLHSIGEAVITTDEAGRVDLLNAEAERLTGWSADAARGRPLEEVFRIVNEETRAPVENPVTRVLREGAVVGLANHTLLLARDGRKIPIADAGAPIRDDAGRLTGVVLVFRDQTAERAAARAVAEARALAEGIVATVRESLLVLDAQLQVVTANRSFYQTFQVTPEQTLGRPVYELGNRQWDIPELRRLLEEILPQNTQFTDFEVTHDFERIGRRTMRLNARRVYGEAHRPRLILLAIEDVTERKRAEAALRELQERDRSVYELISDYAYTFRVEPDGSLRGEWVNAPFVRVFGYTIQEIDARGGWQSMVHPEDLPAMLEHARRVVGGRRDVCETRFVTRTGEVRWIRDHAVPVTDPATGRVVRIHGAAQDITVRKQAEEALRLSEERYRLIGSVVSDYVFYTRVTPDGRLHLEWAAGAFEAITGYTLEEYQARGGWQVTVLPEDRAQDEHDLAQLRAGRRVSTELRIRTKAGEVRWVHVDAHPVLDPARQTLVSIYGAVRDITARKQAEAALRASEERFRRLFENSLVGIYRTTPEGRIEMANPALVTMLGYPSFEELARVNLEAEGFQPETPRARFKTLMERDGQVRGLESAWTRADGTTLYVRESAVAVRDATGRIVAYEGVVEDITDRRRAEQALAEQVRDWQATFDAAADAIILLDPQQRIKRANRTAEQWFGQPPAAMQGQPCHQAVHGLREPPPFCPFGVVRAHGRRQVVEFQHGDRWLELTVDPVWGPGGEFAGAVHYFRDITERRRLEAQLLQAQKMEAIGRLAGGVAHDFNNILAVLLMQTELLLRSSDLPARVREGLDQIQAATERAANLTRQLLLFSRKQVFQPRDLDLNQVVSSMAKMIRRVIGEDIHFELQPAAAPLPLRADPGMIEQVLLNLAVNARDAMPRGGRLVVQTGAGEVDAETARRHPEARPGWHVWLRVEDTGCGIPPEVLPHIFEPFFTTKEAGKGTGLGLATVYSVARQHQGWIEVETEVGRGTAFQVFLPGASQPAAGPPESAPGEAAPGGNETILLVEDDPVLREATRAVLENRGYTVLVAEDGMQALQLWTAHAPRVALLLTDLVMPGGVTGQELARVLLHERPNLKVVYTSGYSAEWSGTEPHLGPNERFLPKPCPAEQLLVTLRRCLDG